MEENSHLEQNILQLSTTILDPKSMMEQSQFTPFILKNKLQISSQSRLMNHFSNILGINYVDGSLYSTRNNYSRGSIVINTLHDQGNRTK